MSFEEKNKTKQLYNYHSNEDLRVFPSSKKVLSCPLVMNFSTPTSVPITYVSDFCPYSFVFCKSYISVTIQCIVFVCNLFYLAFEIHPWCRRHWYITSFTAASIVGLFFSLFHHQLIDIRINFSFGKLWIKLL